MKCFLLIVYFIGLLFTPLRAMEHSENYSDKKPQCRNVATIDMSDTLEWSSDSSDIRLCNLIEITTNLFRQKNYVQLSDHFFTKNNKVVLIFGNISAGRLMDCIALETKYSTYSLTPHLEKTNSYVEPRTDPSKRWHISGNKQQDLMLILREFQEMSWDGINIALHQMHRNITSYQTFKDPIESIFCKKLYKRIRRKGLENSFARIALVVNKDHQYSFNILYETEIENKKGEELIFSLLKTP